MYIESDKPMVPPPETPVKLTVSLEGASTDAILEPDGWDRNPQTGEARIKCYDARSAIVWIHLPQFLLEELVFGEINHGPVENSR
jgi:hypothetical protein